MSFVVNKDRLTLLTCSSLSRASLSNNVFMQYMNNLDELYYFSRDGTLTCEFVRIKAECIQCACSVDGKARLTLMLTNIRIKIKIFKIM
jgi:hypothetical protein